MPQCGGHRHRRRNAVKHQKRGEEKAATDPEQAREKADAEAHAENDQPMD